MGRVGATKPFSSDLNNRKNKGAYERLLEKDPGIGGDTAGCKREPNMESSLPQQFDKDTPAHKIKYEEAKKNRKIFEDFKSMCGKCRTKSWKKSCFIVTSIGLLLLFATMLICGLALAFYWKTTAKTIEKLLEKDAEDEICFSPGCVKAANNLLDSIDFLKNPCDNFYQYACGTWLKNNRIPDDKSSYGNFIKVDQIVKQQLRTLLEKDDVTDEAQSIKFTKQIYHSCMDTKKINAMKSHRMYKLIEEIGGWPMLKKNWNGSARNLTKLSIWSHTKVLMDGLIRLSVDMDSKNVASSIITFDQISLGLGRSSRDYYLNQTAYKKQIEAYKKLLFEQARIFAEDLQVEFAEAAVKAAIEKQLEFETNLAQITVAEENRRNSTLLYNKMTLKEFSSIFTMVDWKEYFEAAAPPEIFDRLLKNDFASYEVIVTQPDYFQKFNELLKKTDKETLFNYIISSAIKGLSGLMDVRFEDANQDFQEIFIGQKEKPARWKFCVSMGLTMQMGAGALYVREHFSAKDRTEALAMIKNLKLAFTEIVQKLDWMDAKTKETAVDKAENMIDQAGYPDFILNDTTLDGYYRNLTYENASFMEMVLSVIKFSAQRDWYDLLRPFDRHQFRSTPAMVNAFYGPDTNSITFPAGILQPPFFHDSYPKFINYGAIGAVIGHEITHGFDDQGSQYDKIGNLRNWWSSQAEKNFRSKTECIVDQYAQYTVPEIKMNLNGKLTQGENIADNGGIKQALRAYEMYVKNNGGPEPRLPGLNLTNQQAFFASFAQFWCGKSKPQNLINQVLTDEHSPVMFRVIGVLSNFDEFSKAFSCPSGSFMNPKKKCAVW